MNIEKPTYEEALQFMHDALVYQRIHLTGPWHGWKIVGSHFVSPDGDRITPERMRGIAWRFAQEARRDAARAKREAKRVSSSVVTVLRIPNNDWHRERFGAIAG